MEQVYEIRVHGSKVPIKSWTKGVSFEVEAQNQLRNVANLPIVHHSVAVMPDVHYGMGATIGSVIPTVGAIIPAAVGVDIGCGMVALRTSLTADQLPADLKSIRTLIERTVPHGRTTGRGRSKQRDRGAWGETPAMVKTVWEKCLKKEFDYLSGKYPRLKKTNNLNHLGTLGTGNHFIELCLDQEERVWLMLHSGSRGVGNAIGRMFIDIAKKEMRQEGIGLVDEDLAYLREETESFNDYVRAVTWAQEFARLNRQIMMDRILKALRTELDVSFQTDREVINCHHNYVQAETHFDKNVWLTRKGAISAQEGEMGIIPGSMGAKSYIVRGKGNPESFNSASHGAGRVLSRTQAKKNFTIEDHEKATEGVECRKDSNVLDETPAAYKSIDAVIEAQKDLVEIVHTLKQIICVKG